MCVLGVLNEGTDEAGSSSPNREEQTAQWRQALRHCERCRGLEERKEVSQVAHAPCPLCSRTPPRCCTLRGTGASTPPSWSCKWAGSLGRVNAVQQLSPLHREQECFSLSPQLLRRHVCLGSISGGGWQWKLGISIQMKS